MKLTKLKLQGCIIFLSGWNKWPQTWKRKPTQICFLPIWRPQVSDRSHWAHITVSAGPHFLWKTGGHLSLPLGVSGGFQHALTCGHLPPFSAPMVTLPYLVSNFPLPPSSFKNNNFYCFIKKISFVSICLCQVLVMTRRIKFPDQRSNLGPCPGSWAS